MIICLKLAKEGNQRVTYGRIYESDMDVAPSTSSHIPLTRTQPRGSAT